MKWKKRKEKNILDKIDKEKFIDDIKKDLNIKHFYVKENMENNNFDFSGLEEVFKTYFECKNHDYKVTPNDIYILYKINKKEAEEGCVKKLKIKRKKWDNKAKRIVTRKDTIKITIPKGIQDSQSIIIYGEGNQDKTSNSGNLILNIKVI